MTQRILHTQSLQVERRKINEMKLPEKLTFTLPPCDASFMKIVTRMLSDSHESLLETEQLNVNLSLVSIITDYHYNCYPCQETIKCNRYGNKEPFFHEFRLIHRATGLPTHRSTIPSFLKRRLSPLYMIMQLSFLCYDHSHLATQFFGRLPFSNHNFPVGTFCEMSLFHEIFHKSKTETYN